MSKVRIHLTLPETTCTALAECADALEISVSAYAATILNRHIAAERARLDRAGLLPESNT